MIRDRIKVGALVVLLSASALSLGCKAKSTSYDRLQAHISKAGTASNETTKHINDFKSTADTIDYKASRANKLLNQGVERPE